MELSSRCEMACSILERTEDGNILSPVELRVLEGAVNDNLNDLGEKMFRELHEAVMNDTFVPFHKRWFRDVENITADTRGAGGGLWIYWKGTEVEHYNMSFAYSDEGMEELQELKRRCETLERRGETVSTATAIWNWED